MSKRQPTNANKSLTKPIHYPLYTGAVVAINQINKIYMENGKIFYSIHIPATI